MYGGGKQDKVFGSADATSRSGTALIAATQLGDELATALASLHMRGAIEQMCADLGQRTDAEPALIALIVDVCQRFANLLRNNVRIWPGDTQRLLRWSAARFRSELRSSQDPDLFESIITATSLGSLDLKTLHAMDSAFRESQLDGSTFDGALLEGCDFGRSSLARTSWRHTRALRCKFGGTVMIDSVLDGALFIDCDFRGADLAAVDLGDRVTSCNTVFVSCDLRESNWSARLIDRARFEDCRFFGVHGRPRVTEVTIERADLSSSGSGSWIGGTREVMGIWWNE